MLRKQKSKPRLILSIAIACLILFWTTGIIPSSIARISATRYVNTKYKDKGFQFLKVEYSSAHGNYFVIFREKEGQTCSFMMDSKFMPVSVWYDPLDPPG